MGLRTDAMGEVLAVFDEDQTVRLTGVKTGQLRYWARSGLYAPEFAPSKIYSFRDISALRVLGALRNQYGVSLQHLRKVGARLAELSVDRWTGCSLWVNQKSVVWKEPGTDLPQSIVSRQYLVPTLELSAVLASARRAVNDLIRRDSINVGAIDRGRARSGKDAVVAGTRIRVAAIRRFRDAGYSVDQIVSEYPDLSAGDVEAALSFEPGGLAA